MMTSEDLIDVECENIKTLLRMKNKAYGNSFMHPANVFCKLPAIEQINVRIDDKINRIAKGKCLDEVEEDTELDLIGYLILKRILKASLK
jgi:hypothetical protein